MKIFGFEIKRQKDDSAVSPVQEKTDDGAAEIISNGAAYYGYTYSADIQTNDESTLINTYRTLTLVPEVDLAVTEITNESIINNDENVSTTLNLDKVPITSLPKKAKELVLEEWNNVIALFDFKNKGQDIFRKWYVDGKIYYNIVAKKNENEGIAELKFIDPTQIKKIREVNKEKVAGIDIVKSIREYYSYNPDGIKTPNGNVELTTDSIIYITSGLVDSGNKVISYLHKAIKPSNQLKFLEDAAVIYRSSRAAERRVFYIDVGNLPKAKAEQEVKSLMNKYRNKLVYDSTTGDIKDDRRHMTMMEDFWMPRREGGKGTEIITLPSGQALDQIADLEYFKDKLAHSLNVPFSRFKNDTGFSLGRSNEINRDEIRFSKFINRVRNKFSNLLLEALKTQIVLKRIIDIKLWDNIKEHIIIVWNQDNYFAELKNQEILASRVSLASQMDPFVGKYYSVNYVQKNILKLTDEQMEQIKKENEETMKNNPEFLGQFVKPMEPMKNDINGDTNAI